MKLSPAFRFCLVMLTAQIMLWAWGASLPHHIHHTTHKICFILHADIPGLNHHHHDDDTSHYPGHCLLKQVSIEATEKLHFALIMHPLHAIPAAYHFNLYNPSEASLLPGPDSAPSIPEGCLRSTSPRGPPSCLYS